MPTDVWRYDQLSTDRLTKYNQMQNTLCPNVNWRYDEEYGNKISTNCLTKWQLTVWPSISTDCMTKSQLTIMTKNWVKKCHAWSNVNWRYVQMTADGMTKCQLTVWPSLNWRYDQVSTYYMTKNRVTKCHVWPNINCRYVQMTTDGMIKCQMTVWQNIHTVWPIKI